MEVVITRRFIRKGANVAVKTTVSDELLSAKEVIEKISLLRKNIEGYVGSKAQYETKIEQLKGEVGKMDAEIPKIEDDVKKLSKFEAWAVGVQESKFKSLLPALKEKIYNRVMAEYKYDDSLTTEQNDLQKFKQFQHYIATDKDLVEVVDESIALRLVHEKGFVNPWKA